MKCMVAYASQTGFTQKYAEWMAEELGCEAVPVKEASETDVAACDVVVFGGWFHASSLVGGKWLARMREACPGTRFIAFVVGATPPEWTDMVDEAMAREFPAPAFDDVERFYLRGGFDYDRLSRPNKLMMKMFFKMQEKEAAHDERAAEMLAGMREGFDGTDRAAIGPVVASARAQGGDAARSA